MRHALRITFFVLLALSGGIAALHAQAPDQRPVHVITMDGAIGPAFAAYLEDGLRRAGETGAQLLVIELNTPGGLLSTTREMVQDIIDAPMPVAVWVTPSGGHAASAGTFILYAGHIAAMDTGTNVGAATPIQMGGGPMKQPPGQGTKEKSGEEENKDSAEDPDAAPTNEEALSRKAVEDTSAFIRGIAEMRGRNAEWAERAVTEALSVTANEALEKNIIDLIAENRDELLSKIDGREMTLKNGDSVTLATKNAPVNVQAPDWKTRLLSYITDPNVAFILMSIGVYGLILEFYNPGTMIPGTVGVICLILGLYAMNVLPVNIAGIALLLAGIGFMAAEAFVPSFGILGIGGMIAFVAGAAFMFDTTGMPGLALNWEVILGVAVFGALIVAMIVLVTVRVYRQQVTTGPESMVGKTGKIIDWTGREGHVRIHGEIWRAYADEDFDLDKDDDILIARVDELKLKVRKL